MSGTRVSLVARCLFAGVLVTAAGCGTAGETPAAAAVHAAVGAGLRAVASSPPRPPAPSAAASPAPTEAAPSPIAAIVAPVAPLSDLEDTARDLISTAQADNLDAADVEALLAQAEGAGPDTDLVTLAAQLSSANSALQALITLNDSTWQKVNALMASVDAAGAEATPASAADLAAYQGIAGAFHDASTTAALDDVAAQVAGLQPAVDAELAAQSCGHAVPAGRAITINLTLQEMVMYETGCAVRATPITSGRPLLRTPTGTFAIFDEQSPFVFHSPWPPSSPFWYPPSPVKYVMEFADGGYFLHDAPWEPDSEYGPGSEDGDGASHGCVHVPGTVMAWLYTWASIGTPVIISS